MPNINGKTDHRFFTWGFCKRFFSTCINVSFSLHPRPALIVLLKILAGRVYHMECSSVSTALAATAHWECTLALSGTHLAPQKARCPQAFCVCAPYGYLRLTGRSLCSQIYGTGFQLELVSAEMHASWRKCQCGECWYGATGLPVCPAH